MTLEEFSSHWLVKQNMRVLLRFYGSLYREKEHANLFVSQKVVKKTVIRYSQVSSFHLFSHHVDLDAS